MKGIISALMQALIKKEMNKLNNNSVLKGVNKTRFFVTTFLTLMIVVLMALTLLVSVNFDIQRFNWFEFSFSVFNFMAGRLLYFSLGMDIASQNEDYVLISNTLKKYRNLIIQKKVNKEFRVKLNQHNLISKCEAYMDVLDSKLMHKKITDEQVEQVEKEKEQLNMLLEYLRGTRSEYTGSVNIETIDVDYDHTTFANMFNFGVGNRVVGAKYVADVYRAGFKYTLPTFITSTLVSFFNAIMVFTEYGFNWQSAFMFAMKMVMFIWGCYQGIQTGKRVIDDDKYPVMLNLLNLAKEIITELEKDLNIVIDEPAVAVAK